MAGREELLSVREVATEVGVLELDTVRSWIKKGITIRGRHCQLEAIAAGRHFKVRRSALEDFLRACKGGTVAPAQPSAAARKREGERGERELREALRRA